MKKQFTPCTIFKTERVEVVLNAPGEYIMYFDGSFQRFYTCAAEAEHAAAMRLEEEARDLAAGLVHADTELAANGMRRADETESGWYVLTSQGKVWATDDFSTARWAA